MTTNNNLTTQSAHRASLIARLAIGGGLALLMMIVFLAGVDGLDEWGDYWKVRPLIVITFAGAVGGLIFHFMDGMRSRGSWQRVLANIVSVIIYVFGLWMGTVLGLNGTLWN